MMLLLTRREGETIVIDGHIEITVSKIMTGGTYSNQVRFGITAAKEITVNRKEIQQKKDSGLKEDKPKHPDILVTPTKSKFLKPFKKLISR